jgi:hypothetical protein
MFFLASCAFIVSGTRLHPREVAPPQLFRPLIANRLLDSECRELPEGSTTLIATGAVILYLWTIRHSRSSPSYTCNSQAAMSVKFRENDRQGIDSLRHFQLSSPLAHNHRDLKSTTKSAGEDYLGFGFINAHFSPNSASTIDFPHENGAGL